MITHSADDQYALLSVIDSLGVSPRSCVYVSTPISTGLRYLEWYEQTGHRFRPGSADYRTARIAIKKANLSAAHELVSAIRADSDCQVIDPTVFADITGWQQNDYHLWWMEVINKYVSTVVFARGWEHSEGCAVEFAVALERQIATVDHHCSTISTATGLGLLQGAAARYAAIGLASSVLAEVTERVAACLGTRPQAADLASDRRESADRALSLI
jgi:hypothetical protein